MLCFTAGMSYCGNAVHTSCVPHVADDGERRGSAHQRQGEVIGNDRLRRGRAARLAAAAVA